MEICLSTIASIVAAYYILRYFWELLSVSDLQTKAIFISGCDSGFGRALALKSAKAGLTVFAGCLTKQGEESLTAESKGYNLLTVPLDVTSDESVKNARKFVDSHLKDGIKFWAVVANAGVFTCYGPDDWCTIEDYRFSVDINCFGVVRCVKAFMDLIKENEGRIVAVSSVAGRTSVPGGAPYAVAKYGVEAYIDSVRQEVYKYNVKCSLLEPGAFKTNLLDKEAMNKRVNDKWNALTPKQRENWGESFKQWFVDNWNNTFHMISSSNINFVVDNYYHAITARYPRFRYLCGYDAIFFYRIFSLLDGRLSDAIFRLITMGAVLPADLERKFNKKTA